MKYIFNSSSLRSAGWGVIILNRLIVRENVGCYTPRRPKSEIIPQPGDKVKFIELSQREMKGYCTRGLVTWVFKERKYERGTVPLQHGFS